jgi:hypothetical protein
MRRKKSLITLVLSVIFACAIQPFGHIVLGAEYPGVPQRIEKIIEVGYAIEKENPPNLVILVVGEVPTKGWHSTVLIRRVYRNPPKDGIWEYDLISIPPDGAPPTQASQIEAVNVWKAYDEASVKGVRVFGVGAGVIERQIGQR